MHSLVPVTEFKFYVTTVLTVIPIPSRWLIRVKIQLYREDFSEETGFSRDF